MSYQFPEIENKEEIKRMIFEGMVDHEIAFALNIEKDEARRRRILLFSIKEVASASENVETRIYDLLIKNTSVAAIAKQIGSTHPTVTKVKSRFDKLGLLKNYKAQRGKNAKNQEKIKQTRTIIKDMIIGGSKIKEIAARLETTEPTVRYQLSEMAIEMLRNC